MSDPFDSGTSGISLALDVPFPANVASGPGVKVDKTTGTWTVSLDFPPLVDAGIPANPSAVYLAGYDTGLGIYEKLRLDNLISGATGLDSRTPHGDSDYIILVGDRYVGLTAALTAVRTWTLPPAANVPGGRLLVIQDEVGGISGANYLRLSPTGADTINGLNSAFLLKPTYGGVAFHSNGTNRWDIANPAMRRGVGDTNFTILSGDTYVATTVAFTAPRIWTLPAANTVSAGYEIMIVDEASALTMTNTLTVLCAGADTVNGAASIILGHHALEGVRLRSDGISKWIFPNLYGTLDGFPVGSTTPATGAFTTLGIASGGLKVGGRLTLTIGTPVMLNPVPASGAVYFTPYEGNLVPLWTGTQFVWTPCAELTNVLANSATGNAGPAAAVASQVYDLYMWSNAGAPTLTRSPPWSAGTGGSNTVRGTGAGGTAQSRVNGILTNVVAITNGPGAGAGTYVGTIATDSGGGNITWSRGGAAVGGLTAILNVWNMYNRIAIGVEVTDSTTTWTNTSTTTVAANSSNGNRATFVMGLAEDNIDASHMARVTPGAVSGAFAACGVGMDTTSVFDKSTLIVNNATTAITITQTARNVYSPVLGAHFIQALEAGQTGQTTTFAGAAQQGLSILLRM